MDTTKINDFLMELGGEWLIWRNNLPTASNMRGVWKQQIISARSILAALLKQHGKSLNDCLLRILLAEVEAIISSRIFQKKDMYCRKYCRRVQQVFGEK